MTDVVLIAVLVLITPAIWLGASALCSIAVALREANAREWARDSEREPFINYVQGVARDN